MTIKTHVYSGHPSTRFMLHDLVSIEWNNKGRITVHEIVGIHRCVPNSQTGTMFLVEPPVDKKTKWIDSAWCHKDGLEVL